ncbi:MAG: small multi-drug export protein [Methylotenera sp.]|nr:small multi-drug export protein [Flavobacterium sp.]
MFELIEKIVSVVALSMVKFFFAPFLGSKLGLHYINTFWACVLGMNLSVILFSFFGDKIKMFIISIFYRNQKKKFTAGNRRLVTIWNKYGMVGIAFLTPPLLTPPVGTLVASGFGEPRKKIVLYMLISSVLWGIIVCYIAYALKEVPFLKGILG